MNVLKIEKLSKNYGHIKAVNELDLTVEKGSIFGILGPNGSGKTTTLGIVLGITNRDGGDYTWFEGQHGKKTGLQIGALLETPNFYPYLNADQNLDIIAHIKRSKSTNYDELLELVNLKHRRTSNFRTYSLGMKQRLAIAAAMVGDPEVLIFDEPTNGLDPQGIAEVRSIIKRIAERGKTIIMASHILDEVEKVCSHVAIMKNGQMLAQGTVGSIISNDITVEVGCANLLKLYTVAKSLDSVQTIDKVDGKLILTVDPSFDTAEINQRAFEEELVLTHLVARQKSLEAEFLEITKEL